MLSNTKMSVYYGSLWFEIRCGKACPPLYKLITKDLEKAIRKCADEEEFDEYVYKTYRGDDEIPNKFAEKIMKESSKEEIVIYTLRMYKLICENDDEEDEDGESGWKTELRVNTFNQVVVSFAEICSWIIMTELSKKRFNVKEMEENIPDE